MLGRSPRVGSGEELSAAAVRHEENRIWLQKMKDSADRDYHRPIYENR